MLFPKFSKIVVAKIGLVVFVLCLIYSCENEFLPRPKGYFRIDFPEKKYTEFNQDFPYSFEYPIYAKPSVYQGNINGKYWLNLNFEKLRATLHLSYFVVNNDIHKHFEDSRKLVYKHTIKADAINENTIYFPAKKVYGSVYEIKGNAASTLQFYVTDSTKHFLRGALYFNVPPNADSLAPINEFIIKDIQHLVGSLSWN